MEVYEVVGQGSEPTILKQSTCHFLIPEVSTTRGCTLSQSCGGSSIGDYPTPFNCLSGVLRLYSELSPLPRTMIGSTCRRACFSYRAACCPEMSPYSLVIVLVLYNWSGDVSPQSVILRPLRVVGFCVTHGSLSWATGGRARCSGYGIIKDILIAVLPTAFGSSLHGNISLK